MDSVFQELKRAREAKRFSIDDVSDATLINAGFLEAIEQGNTGILPQTYVRAFIREYASFVGLDPVDIMKRYDQANTGPAAPAEEHPPPVPDLKHVPEERTGTAEPLPSPPEPLTPVIAKFALPGIVIVALGIIVWNLTRTETPRVTKEIPFESVLQGTGADSAAHNLAARHRESAAATDSITLRVTVTDSAWVQIVIDNREPQQYLFRPNRKITWKARDRFRLSTGNAGAIDLTLNEKHLGAAGKRGAVVRNAEFNRQTLTQK